MANQVAVAGEALGLIGVTASVKFGNDSSLAIIHGLPAAVNLDPSCLKKNEDDENRIVNFTLRFNEPLVPEPCYVETA
jgi:hypothetical protein